MPLKVRENKSPVTNDTTDTGYESNDVNGDEWKNLDDNDEEEPDVWLQSMGMQEDAIKKFNSSQVREYVQKTRLSVSGHGRLT